MTLKQKNTCMMCRKEKVEGGSKEDIERLRKWVKKGKAWAMSMLADRYKEGEGVKQSDKKAIKHHEKSKLLEYLDDVLVVHYPHNHHFHFHLHP